MDKAQRLSILLNVHNCQISLDFYQRLLGLNCTQSWEDEGRVRWCSLEHRASASTRRGGLDHQDCVLYLSVANLAEIRLLLRAEGFDVTEPQQQAYDLLQCSAADPDGYEIALTQPITGSE